MPIVHAYRRKKPHTVELRGVHYKFLADSEGAFVCDVPKGPALDRLLEIDEGYRLHNVDAPARADEEEPELSPFVLSIGDGDETVDLRDLKKAQLIEFAGANELTIDATLKVDEYRLAIVEALNKVE